MHLLKDGQRVAVPVDDAAVDAAIANIEWAVQRIIASDFPARPNSDKCAACDFARLCRRQLQQFASTDMPPPLYLPGGRRRMVAAFVDARSA